VKKISSCSKSPATISESLYCHPQSSDVNATSSNETTIPAVDNDCIITDLEYDGDDHTVGDFQNEIKSGACMYVTIMYK